MKCLDKNDRKGEMTIQQNSSKEDSSRYKESKQPVVCISPDLFKGEQPIRSVSSSTNLGVTSNIEKTHLDIGDRKQEKTKFITNRTRWT